MNVLEAIRGRRSIRKYQDRQIPREDLEKILEAGSFAPNAGGGQRAILVGVHKQGANQPAGPAEPGEVRPQPAGGQLCLQRAAQHHRRPHHSKRVLRRAHGLRGLWPGELPLQCAGRLLLRGEHGPGRL